MSRPLLTEAGERHGILVVSMDNASHSVSDDDLPSLDFTMPGALDLPPPEPAVLSVPPKPAAVEAPPAHLPPVLIEAARLHAAGDDLEAMRRLEAAIKRGEALGEMTVRVWRALFEVLQALGRRQAFDALALAFARHFELSPPTWSAVAATQHIAHATTGGHAHVHLTGALDARAGAVLKETLKLAQSGAVVRFDLAGVDAVDTAGATLFLRALAALKKTRKDYVLGSPQHLADIIRSSLEAGKRENEALWLLLLELYQQAFMQETFEEAAVNYAVTFEKSPPSWETVPPRELPPMPLAGNKGFFLRGQMIGAGPDAFAALAAMEDDVIEIDAEPLTRIDAGSAQALEQVVAGLAAAGRHVVIRGLSVLNAVFLELQGLARSAELVERTV